MFTETETEKRRDILQMRAIKKDIKNLKSIKLLNDIRKLHNEKNKKIVKIYFAYIMQNSTEMERQREYINNIKNDTGKLYSFFVGSFVNSLKEYYKISSGVIQKNFTKIFSEIELKQFNKFMIEQLKVAIECYCNFNKIEIDKKDNNFLTID
jgi:hypothetical protein